MKTFLFSYDSSQSVVRLTATPENMLFLVNQFNRLISGKTDHFHLFTPDWGGHDLTTVLYQKSDSLIHQVNIYQVEESNTPHLEIDIQGEFLRIFASKLTLSWLSQKLEHLASDEIALEISEIINSKFDKPAYPKSFPNEVFHPVSGLQIIRLLKDKLE